MFRAITRGPGAGRIKPVFARPLPGEGVWRHTLITYTHQHGHLIPTMVEPQPMQPVTRYLVSDSRDFFAVYRRVPGPVTVPFK